MCAKNAEEDGTEPELMYIVDTRAGEDCDSGRDSDDEADDQPLSHGLRAPGRLWKRLMEHQRVSLEWLGGLHEQNVGGIMGDDM